ncbi:MAG: tetratricopeptide repeat protein [bacterium]
MSGENVPLRLLTKFKTYQLLGSLLLSATLLFGLGGCGTESKRERALRLAKQLSNTGDLSDTEVVKNLKASNELLKKLASIKLEASTRQAYVLEKLVLRYEEMNMLKKAARYADQWVQLQPGDARAHLIRGRIYSKMANLDKHYARMAERAFQKALSFKPDLLEAKFGLGTLYAFRLDNVSKGREFLEEVALHTRVRAKHIEVIKEARFALGKLEYEQGNYGVARKVFQKIVDMDGITSASKLLAHRNLGRTYRRLNLSDQALKHYRKAYEIDPSNQRVREALTNMGHPPDDRISRFQSD